MAFFQLNDVFGYQHANAMKRLWAAGTAPVDPGDGEVWLDTSVTPNRLKRYNGTTWEIVGDMTAGELLTLLKTVDGAGSGLDADTLDGKEALEFLQKNSDGTLIDISGTDLNDLDASGLYKGGSLTNNPDDSEPEVWGILHTKHTSLFQNQIAWNLQHLQKAVIYMRVMGNGTWGSWFKIWTQYSDGSGSGLDADKLDGQEGSYYQDASNLNAGTLNKDRLPAEVVRTDQDTDVSAHTEWQDTYQARFGNNGDLKVQHNGTDSFIDNYNGYLAIRQLSHGNNIYMQAEDDSGTMKNLLTLDPDVPEVKVKGALTSVITESYSLANSTVLNTGIGADSHGILIVVNETDNVSAAFYLFRTPTSEIAANGEIQYLARDTAYFLGNYSTDHVSIQVYWSSTNSQIQIRNHLGSSKDVSYTFMGLRFDV